MDSPLVSAPFFYGVNKKKKHGNTTADTQATELRFEIQADSDRESLRGQLLEAFELILAFCDCEKSRSRVNVAGQKSLPMLIRCLHFCKDAGRLWRNSRA